MLKSLRRPLKQVRVPQYRYECPLGVEFDIVHEIDIVESTWQITT
jgi:hypothetical protein